MVRDPHLPSDDLTVSFKRLSASSTGSTRSTHSSSSLDLVPVRDSACPASLAAPGGLPGKPLVLDLEQAMERLSRLQQAVESSVSLLMSFIVGGWRRPGNLEGNLPAVRQASDRVRNAVRDFLEFARGAVANAGQATDRSLQAKLGRQVGKMEEVFQSLVRSGQGLDALGWAPAALVVGPTPTPGAGGPDDLDRLILTARGVPDDTKQLASFLHGNASLLFKRSGRLQQQQQQQQQLPLPPIPGEVGGHPGSGGPAYQGGERVNIQARPLPSPPKFTPAEEEGGGPYETTEEGWMEDYDYVHLQVRARAQPETCTHTHRDTCTHPDTCTHRDTCMHMEICKHLEKCTQPVICIHPDTCRHPDTCTYRDTCTHPDTCTNPDTCTHPD